MSDENLVDALRAAGHNEAANRLRDEQLAQSLRQAGHDDVAATLDQKLAGGHGSAPAAGALDPADAARAGAERQRQEGEQFVEDLRAALRGNSVSIPGLLDA